MRKLLALALLMGVVGLTTSVRGQEPEPKGKLKVGDAAPAVKATKWLQGTEVKEFAPGKVYIVEFWATWCGPCIVMMPHMAELQAEFKDKGVTFIGFSSKDANNNQEKVTTFVEKRGPKLGYTFAYEDNRETNEAWMKAAQRNGIPCCFVVDKAGKIAYIGHPMYLDIVLPKVVDGTWKNDEDNAAMEKVEKDVNAVFKSFSNKGTDEALKVIKEFESNYPKLNKIPYFNSPRLNLLVTAEKFDEAKKFAEELVARGIKQDDPAPLSIVANVLRTVKDNKDLLGIALKAAEAGLKLAGDKDARALLTVAEAQFALGDKAKARDYAAKAVTAAETESPAIKRFVETQAKKFEDGDK